MLPAKETVACFLTAPTVVTSVILLVFQVLSRYFNFHIQHTSVLIASDLIKPSTRHIWMRKKCFSTWCLLTTGEFWHLSRVLKRINKLTVSTVVPLYLVAPSLCNVFKTVLYIILHQDFCLHFFQCKLCIRI